MGKVPEFQSSFFLSLDHLTAVTGVGSSPALATCETSNVLLAGVSSEVENIFTSLVAKEQLKYTCFSLQDFSLMHWE